MTLVHLLRDAVLKSLDDDVMTLAGSLAFFTILSLAPMIIILVGLLGFFGETIHTNLIDELTGLVGPNASAMIDGVVQHAARNPLTGGVSAILGLLMVVVSATGVFVQLQKSMNRLWGVELRSGRHVWRFIRQRVISLGMVLGIGFVLLVSLAVSTVTAALVSGEGWIWSGLEFGTSLLVYVILFAFILRYLPDVKIRLRDATVGAVVTAVFFSIGKELIGQYLGRSSIGSAYGAAGSLVIFLVWVYYSSLILFLGTEVTVLYTRRFGKGAVPTDLARWCSGSDPGSATE